MTLNERANIVSELQSHILRLQGLNRINSSSMNKGLGPLNAAFPNSSFPLGVIHEFLAPAGQEDAAATAGFIGGLLSSMMHIQGIYVWIGSSRKLFPPALTAFGLRPDHFIFIDVQKEKEVLWVIDEVLKCGAVNAVVGELKEISFTNSRRLQLAVEQSHVTGFLVRSHYKTLGTTACVSRWKITSLPSESIDGLPGIGSPKWKVELLRIRNGTPGVWELQWREGRFVNTLQEKDAYPSLTGIRKAG